MICCGCSARCFKMLRASILCVSGYNEAVVFIDRKSRTHISNLNKPQRPHSMQVAPMPQRIPIIRYWWWFVADCWPAILKLFNSFLFWIVSRITKRWFCLTLCSNARNSNFVQPQGLHNIHSAPVAQRIPVINYILMMICCGLLARCFWDFKGFYSVLFRIHPCSDFIWP